MWRGAVVLSQAEKASPPSSPGFFVTVFLQGTVAKTDSVLGRELNSSDETVAVA
jgi:hypothetical protein